MMEKTQKEAQQRRQAAISEQEKKEAKEVAQLRKRICSTPGCGTVLSLTNKDDRCRPCQHGPRHPPKPEPPQE